MPQGNSRTPLHLLVALIVIVALTATSTTANADPGPPGAPTNVTTRASNQLVMVSWDAPTADDPTITGYTVTVSPPDVTPISVGAATRTVTVTGLANGTAYTFTVTATNASGTGSPSQPSTHATPTLPAATTLRLAVSRSRVLYGGTAWLTGILRNAAGHGLSGQKIVVEHRRRGATAWAALTARTTGAGGRIPAIQVRPLAHMHYRLRHAATPFQAASASGLGVVLVGMRISARFNAGRITVGTTTAIGGTVAPAHHGKFAQLQQKVGRTWRTVQRTRLASNGRYRFTLRPRTSGTTWWRVYKASDTDHLGVASSLSRLVVLPRPKPKPKPKPKVKPRPSPKCDPSYPGVCLRVGIGDYDCAGGSGNGPNYVRGPIRVRPPDPFGLDRDGNGWGCE
jgi:hypothetical protein